MPPFPDIVYSVRDVVHGILGIPLNKSNFVKKINSMNVKSKSRTATKDSNI